MRENVKIKRYLAAALVILAFLTAGCGDSKGDGYVIGQQYYHPGNETDAGEALEPAADTEAPADETGTDLFLVTSNDMQAECLILKQLASGKQYMYYYSITTKFLDKYGNRTTASCFEPGRVVLIGKKDVQGRLLEASLSDAVWEYPDVTRYTVDEERGVFRIAETNYSYGENLFVHSNGEEMKLADLSDLDTLRIVGIGKQILSVSVTTGHGELQFANTELFEGSFAQIGSKIFSEVTKDMHIELPEGTYVVAVANKGYGGSAEVEVVRGKTTVLDLDAIKGEGPKHGSILFAVDVEGAVVSIDGAAIDYSGPVDVQYGVHDLQVSAESYDTYRKKLFVNSERATIIIGLTGEDTAHSAESSEKEGSAEGDNQTENGTNPGSLAGSLAGSRTGGGSANSSIGAASEAELNAIVDGLLDDRENSSDYLSTITDLLKTLTGTDD